MTRAVAICVMSIGFVLAASAPVTAQVSLEIAKITCGQYLGYKVANPKSIAIWLNGYYHGKRGDTVIDTQQLDQDTDKIQKYCAENPDALLMQAVETVVGPRD